MLSLEVRLSHARAHEKAGRPGEAALLYESILEVDPFHVEAAQGLALFAIQKGEVEEALSLLRRAAMREVTAPLLHAMAKAYCVVGKGDEAEETLAAALDLDPAHSESVIAKAELLAQKGALPEAEKTLAALIDTQPKNAAAHVALAILYANAGLFAEALTAAEEALALHPQGSSFKSTLGAIFLQAGNPEAALPLLEAAFLATPADGLLLIRLAEAHAACGSYTEARRFAQRAVLLYPDMLPAWRSLMEIDIQRGEGKAALAEFAKVARMAKDRVGALLLLAGAQRAAGEPALARRLIEALLVHRSSLPKAQRIALSALLRDCAFSLGDFAEGVREMEARDHHAMPLDMEQVKSAILTVDPRLPSLEAFALLRLSPAREKGEALQRVECPAPYGELLALVEGVTTDFSQLSAVNDEHRIPLGSLVRYVPFGKEEIRARIPYVHADEEARASWAEALRPFPRPWLALAWEGGRPGLLLDDLKPLFANFPGTLIGLNWDESRHQVAHWPAVVDAGVHMKSLAALTGLLAEIDGVLGVNGIALHVAGAMGKKGLLLSKPYLPWYWAMDAKGQALWYPSITVVRADNFGVWPLLLPSLAAAVATWCTQLIEGEAEV